MTKYLKYAVRGIESKWKNVRMLRDTANKRSIQPVNLRIKSIGEYCIFDTLFRKFDTNSN